MEEHTLRGICLEIVAVHAVVLQRVVRAVVFVDGRLREVRQVTLVKAHLAIELVARFDQTVRKIFIDGLSHVELVGGMFQPLSVAVGIERHAECLSCVFVEQGVPGLRVKHQFAIFASCCRDFSALFPFDASRELIAVALYLHVERCDVLRDIDVAVFRENVGRFLCRRGVVRHPYLASARCR